MDGSSMSCHQLLPPSECHQWLPDRWSHTPEASTTVPIIQTYSPPGFCPSGETADKGHQVIYSPTITRLSLLLHFSIKHIPLKTQLCLLPMRPLCLDFKGSSQHPPLLSLFTPVNPHSQLKLTGRGVLWMPFLSHAALFC